MFLLLYNTKTSMMFWNKTLIIIILDNIMRYCNYFAKIAFLC